MELKEFLTESEQKTRKWWLALLFVGGLTNAIVFFLLLGTESMPTPGIELPFAFRVLGFGTGVAFCYLYYALCYQRPTTFLLTVSLFAFWFGILSDIVYVAKGAVQANLFLGYTVVSGTLNYIFSLRMRRLNKALKGYAKYPEESKQAAALIQSAVSKNELQNIYSDGIKKWPRLKWVLQRERKRKDDLLQVS